MKAYLLIIFLIFQISFGQERVISGKVLGDDLLPLPGVAITYNFKGTMTDINGYFELKIPNNLEQIKLAFLGCYDEYVSISTDCNYYGIILQTSSTYCFVTPQKANRLEKRHRKKVSKLYKEAYDKKLFGEKKSCR